MRTVEEVRRLRLRELREKHGSLADLNEKLGLTRRDSTLSQIINSAKNSRTGKGKEMGSPLARRIEAVFELEPGWMDTDPGLLAHRATLSPAADLAAALESLEPTTRNQAIRLCWEVVRLAQGGSSEAVSITG